MSLGERCDEIMRLIDEVLGDQPAAATRDDATVAVVPRREANARSRTNSVPPLVRPARS